MEVSKDFEKLKQYLEPYYLNQAAVAKTVVIKEGGNGDIVAAQSRKLSNIVLNIQKLAVALDLKTLIEQIMSAVPLFEVVGDVTSGEVSYDTLLNALEFLNSALELTEISINQQQAHLLLALHQLNTKNITLTYELARLQTHMPALSVSENELQELLEDLIDLRCIRREGQQLKLVEKIVLQQVSE